MDHGIFGLEHAPRGSLRHNLERDVLIRDVNTSLSVFETELTELERLWLMYDQTRTADPATFERDVSVWRPRQQALKEKLDTYWSSEHSKGHDWAIFYHEQCVSRTMTTANVMFEATHERLVNRCEQLGFLDFLQAAVLSRKD